MACVVSIGRSWADAGLGGYRTDLASNLHWYLAEWLEQDDAANLALRDVHVVKIGAAWQVSGRLVQQGPPYRLRVPMAIDELRFHVDTSVASPSIPFHFTVPHRSVRIARDPDEQVFRVLRSDTIPKL